MFTKSENKDSRKSFAPVVIVCFIMSNLVLFNFPILEALAPGFVLRSLDLTVIVLLLLGIPASIKKLPLAVRYPQTKFLILFFLSVIGSTFLSLSTNNIPQDDLFRIARFSIRLLEVLFLAFMMRLHIRADSIRSVFWFLLLFCALLPARSLYLQIIEGSALTRIGFVSVGSAVTGVDTEQADFNEMGAIYACFVLISLAVAMQSNTNFRKRVLSLGLTVLFVTGLFLTGSRSGVMGLFLGLLILTILSSFRQRVVLSVVVGLLSLLIVLGTFSPESMLGRIEGTFDYGSVDNVSALARLGGVQSAWAVFCTSPITGVGYSCFRDFSEDLLTTPENYYMEILADLGIIGISIWLWYLCTLVRSGFLGLQKNNTSDTRSAHRLAMPPIVCLLATCMTGNNFFNSSLLLFFLFLCSSIEVTSERNTIKKSPEPFRTLTATFTSA